MRKIYLDKTELKRYADVYDIHFIFDDDVPEPDFYAVPQVDIVARDSEGGFIGTIGQESDLDSDAPICYINNRKECFLIAKSGKEFLDTAASWKSNIEPYSKITFYLSKSEAEKELEFFDISSIKTDDCGPSAYMIK